MDGFEYINSEINEKIKQLEDHTTLGHLASYEEYKFLCGQIRGLLTARDIMNDLKNKLENDDD